MDCVGWGASVAAAPIYLDHQATTPCDPAVVEAMAPLWSDGFANPSRRSHRPGLEAARELQQQGCRITFTACYEPQQVLLAAALGVDYIAPYLGRISDLGRDGHGELIAMQRCIDALGSTLRLLVASLRSASDLPRRAAEGLNTFTISPAIAQALFSVEATEAAAAQFERDAL